MRIATKSEITITHLMFKNKNYAGPENFTHPPDVMDMTFRRSALDTTETRLRSAIEQHYSVRPAAVTTVTATAQLAQLSHICRAAKMCHWY